MKKKQMKVSLIATLAVLGIVCVFGIGLIVQAFNGVNDGMICEAGSDCTFLEADTPAIDTNNGDFVGATASPYVPYLDMAGLRTYGRRVGLTTASSSGVVCAIQAPAATSTLTLGAIDFRVSSTSASQVDIAKGVNSSATTTSLIDTDLTLGANGEATFIASTTGSTAKLANIVFKPNQWFVVSMKGGAGGTTFSPTGACSAEFKQLSY